MQPSSLTNEQRQATENYLNAYSLNHKLLRLDRYEKQFLGFRDAELPDREIINEAPLARARMFEVRHFILSLSNGNEKLFLYYHYVRCESVERCAELLGISRRTAYRLKNRALAMAWERLHETA